MAYSVIDKSTLYQNTVLWTGDASTGRSITGVGFQPDWVWVKNRDDGTRWHILVDAVRGSSKIVYSNETSAGGTDTNQVESFDADGFSVGSDSNVNKSGDDIVGWNWKANGAGSLNEVGSIDSTVSVNTTSGFSIVTWVATGAASTIGHGLGVVPKMIIPKSTTSVDGWYLYNAGVATDPETDYMLLNTTAAAVDGSTLWNDTAPTSSVFTVGTGFNVGNTYVAYCFADVQGYSKFGSYTGNGDSDGPFVYTGFKPTYVTIKWSSGVGDWVTADTKRSPFNLTNKTLYPNDDAAEYTGYGIDILSNGFKMRTTDTNFNSSGGTYVYMAFGQPIISNSGICATAR